MAPAPPAKLVMRSWPMYESAYPYSNTVSATRGPVCRRRQRCGDLLCGRHCCEFRTGGGHMQAELCDGGEAGAYGCTATASGEHYLRGPVKLSLSWKKRDLRNCCGAGAHRFSCARTLSGVTTNQQPILEISSRNRTSQLYPGQYCHSTSRSGSHGGLQ